MITAAISRARRNFSAKIAALYGVLIAANLAAWAWAFIAFHHYPLLLGTALLAYSFGLRHAVDADHIAAIDNATRKLMSQGQRPATLGLFFSLGHSSIVVLASLILALGVGGFKTHLYFFRSTGAIIGTLVSSSFLFAIAAINGVILLALFRNFRAVRAGAACSDADLNTLLSGRGLLARLLRPLLRLVTQSWHMYPLGLLFGLGFDTATEIGLLGIAATQSAQGLPVWSILVFPALFTAGMSLIDTTDGLLMRNAYGWAFIKPIRKLYYNLTITLVSVAVAVLIGGIEALGLIGDQCACQGRFWRGIGALNNHFGLLGYLIIGVFIVSWALSVVIYRARGYHRLEAETS